VRYRIWQSVAVAATTGALGPLRYVRAMAREIATYSTKKFPMQVNGPAIAVTFLCGYGLYGRAAGTVTLPSGFALALLTFFILFIQLRLVDDLADKDLQHNGGAQVATGGGVEKPGALWAALGATICAVVAVNHDWAALAVAFLALGATLVADLGLKRTIRMHQGSSIMLRAAHWAALLILYEGAAFLIFLYLYYSWLAITHIRLPTSLVLAVTAAFWSQYEFWKYSRHFSRPDWQTYDASIEHTRLALIGIVTVSLFAQIALYRLVSLPALYLIYSVTLCGVFILWVFFCSATEGLRRAQRWWRDNMGLLFVAGVILGLAFALISTSETP